MEKVLVTGATGYIGLHCIQQLLDQGYAVNGSVRSPERKNEIYDALKKHNLIAGDYDLLIARLEPENNIEIMFKYLRQCNKSAIVCHFCMV